MLSSYCEEARLGPGLRGVGGSREIGREMKGGGLGGVKVNGEGVIGREGEGLRILDLGCGWGSLGLFLAEVSWATSLATHSPIEPHLVFRRGMMMTALS